MNNNRIFEIKERLKQLETEKKTLLEELDIISKAPTLPLIFGSDSGLSAPKTSEEKIQLFSKLFRCREDVYPKLWENVFKGTKGYSPVCKNEWISNLCNKPKIKCSDCSNKNFAQLDGSVIKQHLEGKITIGTYAIREDETCIFLAADFDKASWKEDVLAYQRAGQEMGVQISIERSRSGNGAHAWIFFNSPIQSRIARQLGGLIMSRAIAKRYSISLESYDRFFPNQDTLPKGGFGNLIALPLQRAPRQKGNTVFVDDQFNPYPEQWEYLSKSKMLSSDEVHHIIAENVPKRSKATLIEDIDILQAEKTIDIIESKLDQIFLGDVILDLDSGISINITGFPSKLISALKRTATFANPKYFELQRLRFSTWKTPKYIFCGELNENQLVLPRGLFDDCLRIVKETGANIKVLDQRKDHPKFKVRFKGELNKNQKIALKEISEHENGVLVAPPGSGKTVIGCALIAKRKLPTLVLVHRKQLMVQWKQQLLNFLNLDKKQIGIFENNQKRRTGIIDIGMLQTLSKALKENSLLSDYGQIIIDECHHIPAISFETTLKRISAKYFLGLTATPYRKDGLNAIIHMQCGPVRHTMTETDSQNNLIKKVIVRESNFKMSEDSHPQPQIHEIWYQMIKNQDRLNLIAMDVKEILKLNRFPLILSERRDHLEYLNERISAHLNGIAAKGFILSGDVGKKERNKILAEIKESNLTGSRPYLLATGSLIGEGFDMPELCTLILAMPVSFKGRMIQYAGRIQRESPGKTEIQVYDYVDINLGLTISMFKRRLSAYKKMGYHIELPENAKIFDLLKKKV